MEIGDAVAAQEPGHWDRLIEHLQAYRASVGNPSYAELAERLSRVRQEAGADAYAARIARSTVYDALRPGRPRANVPLLREVGLALGVPAADIDGWIRSCDKPVSPFTLSPVDRPVDEPADPPTSRQALLLIVACIGLNHLGLRIVDWLSLPIYLDMFGTAIAAIALGPWRGAAVGVASNTLGVLSSGWVALPFGLVNLVGGLVWGYGVRRWGFGRSLPRYFVLNVLVAVACSATAVPILVAVYGDRLRVGHDAITNLIQEHIHQYWLALPVSNLMTSTMDKVTGGFLALVVITALPAAFRAAFPLAMGLARLSSHGDGTTP
ncbi:hypothetical protein [Nocardioides montaniterrae]